MKPTPPDWPRISTALYYDDPAGAIDWLCNAFGFQLRIKIHGDNGSIRHSELVYGGGVIMVSGPRPGDYPYMKPPSQVDGANTQNMMVYVDDADAHCQRARDAGATIVSEPAVHDYGDDYWADRGYECVDIGRHHWWFYHRVRTKGRDA